MEHSKSFTLHVARSYLSRACYRKYVSIINGLDKADEAFANDFARGLIKWASRSGATHYTHIFVPLTNKPALKLTTLYSLDGTCTLNGHTLLCAEADASSFPSGTERDTSRACGYTVWNVLSPIYIMELSGMVVMCIPALFSTFGGTALDYNTALVRSTFALNEVATHMARKLGVKCNRVTAQLGVEQEYFLVDATLCDKREDINLTGRALLNDALVSDQHHEAHYFSVPSDKVARYMHDVDSELCALGIDVQLQHSEVAPKQFEVVCKYCDVITACDNNQLVMTTLDRIARKHGMRALLHEKPFASINGSGKHSNWSLMTDAGENVFTHTNKRVSELFSTALISAVDEYASLLRVCTATRGNELRLGGNEAPPCIISVYTGEQMEGGTLSIVPSMNVISRGSCDRNRTSPFAFTGNKWEFRTVGSSQSCALVCTMLNTILAHKLNEYIDMLESTDLNALIASEYQLHKRIIFNGNGYSQEWNNHEAKARGLYCEKNTLKIYNELLTEHTCKLFEYTGVLSRSELQLYFDTLTDKYISDVKCEGTVLNSMLTKSILPKLNNWATSSDINKTCILLLKALNKDNLALAQSLNKTNFTSRNTARIISLLDSIATTYTELSPYIPTDLLDMPTTNKILFS